MKIIGTYLDKLDAIPREFISNIIADEYDSTKTYALNDVCLHDSHVYKCIVAITTAEEWTTEHWEETKLSIAISSLTALINSTFLKLTGGTMTGAIITTADDAILKNSDSSVLAIYGGTNYSSGGGLVLRGKGNSNPGSFSLKTVTTAGASSNVLMGKPDGTLTWGSNDISGKVITLSPTMRSGIDAQVYAYRVGKIVIFSVVGYNATALGGNVNIVTNLPKPLHDWWPFPISYYNTFNKGTRIRLLISGSTGVLSTDTEGLAADYFNISGCYIAAD